MISVSVHVYTEDFSHAVYYAVIPKLFRNSHFVCVCVCTVFACSNETQTHLVRATSAIERAVFITMHWVSNISSSTQSVSQMVEELKTEVKNTGGYFQLLIQVHGKCF